MTPRGTDWTLALLAALGFGTGVLSLVSGRAGDAWVFGLHGAGGAVLGLVVGWKLWRVWWRLVDVSAWDRRTQAGVAATALVALTLLSGWVWSAGGDLYVAGWNLLNWHIALGLMLSLAVGLHGVLRAKPLRARDVVSRRQFLQVAGVSAASLLALRLQRPAPAALGLDGAARRWTGSYEHGSYQGNEFPATSWVADSPLPLLADTYRLRVGGLVARPLDLPLAELDRGDTLEATLDCTGGFYSTQRWRGALLGSLLDEAGVEEGATHVRVLSHTGYRWSFPLAEARGFLLATAVGEERLSHEHGAPVRLVAPERRGFQWVKWVVRLELHEGFDYGAAASTVWSSLTPEGRGER